MTLATSTIDSPVGTLTLAASDVGLVAVLWPDDDPARVRLGSTIADHAHPVLRAATDQLRDYFAGGRTGFDLPLDWRGTAFQTRVWAALLTIPYGATRSYGAIAQAIEAHSASRAVGAANGRNPLSIIVPCHRVVGTNGHLTGFAGGLRAKAWLLAFERGAAELPF